MKIKHLLLSVAAVTLMAACGNKATTETTTETAPETVAEEVVETVTEEIVAEQPVAETKAPAAKKAPATTKATTQETKPAVDPCENAVKEFSAYVAQLEVAKKQKDSGAAAMRKYKELKADAANQEAKVKGCTDDKYKAVVNSLRQKVKVTIM